jgi:hypothetical protein
MWIIGGYSNLNDVWYYEENLAPVITSLPPLTATVGAQYDYTVTASGVPAPTFGASGLPGWLSLNGNTLSGTPGPGDIGQTGVITITATNASGIDDQLFQIDVQGVPPLFTSTPTTAITVGTLYSYTVAASGVPAPMFSAGALPGWLSFNAGTGELSGTPGTADIGVSAAINITASNGWPPDDVQTFQISVNGIAPLITSTPGLTATVGSVYSYSISATGDPPPTFSVIGNPPWLTLAGDILSGTPTGSDIGTTGTITITAANGWAPDDTQAFQVTVSGIAPTFTSTPIVTATPGSLYQYTAVASGTPAPSLSAGTLPAWLTFNAGTGELIGTPANSDGGSNVVVTLTASNGINPDAMQSFTINVAKAPELGTGGDSGGCASRAPAPDGFAWIAVLAACCLIAVACRCTSTSGVRG